MVDTEVPTIIFLLLRETTALPSEISRFAGFKLEG